MCSVGDVVLYTNSFSILSLGYVSALPMEPTMIVHNDNSRMMVTSRFVVGYVLPKQYILDNYPQYWNEDSIHGA